MSFIQDWASRRCYSWATERPLEDRPRRSPKFKLNITRSPFHLEMSVYEKCYTIRLHSYYSKEYSIKNMNITVHVEDRKRNALPLSGNKWDLNDNPVIWKYEEAEILKVVPNFLEDGLLIFLITINTTEEELVLELKKGEPVPVSVQTEIETEDKCIQKFSGCSCLESLSADLSKLLEENLGSNVLLVCGEKSIAAHKHILYTRSKVLASMLQYDIAKGQFDDGINALQLNIDSKIFDQFVRFLYTGSLPELTTDTAKHLYEAGGRYNVGSLMRRSASFLLENLEPGNACDVLVLANNHNDSEFQESVVDYILQNEIPLLENYWLSFTENHAQLASKVLYRFYKIQKSK